MFYTYIHRRESDNKPFYIGKGKGDRACSKKARNPHWHRVVAKHGLKIEITAAWDTESEAFAHEAFLIWCFRDMGFELTNQTTGGEGGSHNAETRAKLSLLSKGRKRPPRTAEHREKLHLAHVGRQLTQEHRNKLRVAGLNRRSSAETRQRISESVRKSMTSEHRHARSVRQLGGLNHGAKSVVCIETGAVFLSAADAARWLQSKGKSKAAKSAISACCLGKMRTAYKFTWAYAKEVVDDASALKNEAIVS